MIRKSCLLALFLLPLHASATQVTAEADTASANIAVTHDTIGPPTPPDRPVLPPMRFFGSVLADELLGALQEHPHLAGLDASLAGSPLTLTVTHTMRPTAGGMAAGLVSAVLAGGSLGILPVVSNERLVLRYQVHLNSREIALYEFENTATRAENIWAVDNARYDGLGKAAAEWAISTADEVAIRLAEDPALRAVRDEIAFYYPDALTHMPADGADDSGERGSDPPL